MKLWLSIIMHLLDVLASINDRGGSGGGCGVFNQQFEGGGARDPVLLARANVAGGPVCAHPGDAHDGKAEAGAGHKDGASGSDLEEAG